MLGNIFQRRTKETAPPLPATNEEQQPSEPGPESIIRKVTAQGINRDTGTLLALFTELESNWKTAREGSPEGLVALPTRAWEASQHVVRRLDPEFRSRLENIYADIILINQIAWLASEFHHETKAMRDQYVQLSVKVARELEEALGLGLGPA